MENIYKKLFEPMQIGRLTIKNRVAMAPMGIAGLVNPDGSPGPRAIDYYLERARGGVGLIITSVFKAENEIENAGRGVFQVTPAARAPFAELAESVHALGARIFVQLTAGFGRVIRPARLTGRPVSASENPYFWDPDVTCRALGTEEVRAIARAFAGASRILADAGIDGVELHGHEGYLFDQFATSLWNKREDKYGGDLRGRLSFALEVLKAIKGEVGSDFPVQYRFGLKHYLKSPSLGAVPGEEFAEAGRDIEEGLEMAGLLEKEGFDALHVDTGSYESHYWSHPPMYQDPACMIEMAAAVKNKVSIPVIGVGKLLDPLVAGRVLMEEKADMVALGRGLLADPYWVSKTGKGQAEKIRPCIGCYEGCLGRVFAGKPLSCAVNPATGKERSHALAPSSDPGSVLVVGGGIAGLEAARVAAMRGHRVSLVEKNDYLGGLIVPASKPDFKYELRKLLEWYENEIVGLDIELLLNQQATEQHVMSCGADTVIIATGTKPMSPAKVMTGTGRDSVTAIDVLGGKYNTGDRVVVIGGGITGCETGLWLAQQGKVVTIVEMLEELMSGRPAVPFIVREMLLDLLAYRGVKLLAGTRVISLSESGVYVRDSAGEEKMIIADNVVHAIGLEPLQDLYLSLSGQIPNLFLIGDARKPRNVMGAVWDAYEVARFI